jgi:hypothetical protein
MPAEREAAPAVSGDQRHYELQQALADALRLAHLQVDVLDRLLAADEQGDDEAVQRAHTQLDHVMSRVAEVDRVRTGAKAAGPAGDDLACAGCGAPAQPQYETPTLLGYFCAECGWTAHAPGARAAHRRAEAQGAATKAVEHAVPVIDAALNALDQRGKKARTEGIGKLRALQDELVAVNKRLRSTASGS